MKGVIFEAAGAEPKVVNTLDKPTPGPGQILVKSLWTAMNPVDLFMGGYGQLVVEWPLVLGVDASGVIVETTPEAESQFNLKKGDYVCGCTRLGYTQYGTGQEYFLMDAEVTIPKPKNVDLTQAAALGVGMDTAGLGLFAGLGCDTPDIDVPSQEKDDWVVILGGASSVGGYAIQLAKAAGYKVLSSCSARSADSVKSLGAEVFDYKLSMEQQVDAVMKITNGKVNRIFDAVAGDDPVLAKELFKKTSSEEKFFSTTNDWTGITDFEGGKSYLIALGPVGRPEATTLNKTLRDYIPMYVKLIEAGKVKPGDCSVHDQGGFDGLIGAYKHKTGGSAGSTKVVVKVQDE